MNTSEPKARSRISVIKKIDLVPSSAPISLHHHPRKSRDHRSFVPNFSILKKISIGFPPIKTGQLGKKYLLATPWLGLAAVLYGVLIYIFNTVRPSAVANIVLYQSYIPVILVFFFATLGLSRFIFLDRLRALAVTFWLTLILFLKLQSFEISPILLLSSALIFVGFPLILPVLFRK